MVNDPKGIFKTYCRKHNMRFTPERALIIEEIYLMKGHFDVDKIYLQIRKKHPEGRLAKGSIYRSIPHLVSAGLLRESLTDENRKYYEPALGSAHHDHLKCIACGRVLEFSEKAIDEAQKRLLKKLNFEMVDHMHVISGYCSKCRNKVRSK